MSDWKRNIDEPFKRTIVNNVHELNPTDRSNFANDMADKACEEMAEKLWNDLGAVGGSTDDFAFAMAMATQMLIPTAFAKLAQRKAVRRHHIEGLELLANTFPTLLAPLFKKLYRYFPKEGEKG